MAKKASGTVYLIHIHGRVHPDHPCRHYLGWAQDLDSRIQEHQAGTGARLLAVANERGLSWEVVRTWEGGRSLEKDLKRQKNSPRFCPICNPRHE
jgi:predicted GIY-YIG superfamily endonuclease